MLIDNSNCKNAINQLKNNIANAFTACHNKNTTYNGTENSSTLVSAINGIQNGSGGSTPSVNMNAQSCGHFNVTWAEATSPDNIPQQFTVDFSSVGVTFRSLVIYSASRDGYFSVNRIDSTKCVISAHPFLKYNGESINGVTDLGAGTYRANYIVNGNSITFTRANYPNDGVNFGGTLVDNFRTLPTQLAPISNPDPVLGQEDYLLELINLTV